MSTLSCLSPAELTDRLYELRSKERALLVESLVYLGELDRRKLYLDIGFASSFEFCVGYLGRSNGATFRRLTAARLFARFPVLAEYLRDGRLGLTTLVLLRDVLSDERLGEILDRAAGRTEDQVKLLVATLAPKPPVPDLVRRAPERRSPAPEPPRNLDLFDASAASTSGREVAPCQPQKPPARLEPISEEQHVLRMTVGREFVADLEKVRAALSHVVPDRSLEKVLHECIRRTLRACERRNLGSTKARIASAEEKPAKSAKRTRTIPAEVRREVWQRDGGRCTFVGEEGHRCGSTHMLEFHHLEAFALGGLPMARNLTLYCAPHNRGAAEKELGAARVAEAIARRRRARGRGREAPTVLE